MKGQTLDLAATPHSYPQKLDILRDAALLIEMSEADYRAASFLDDRILTAAVRGQWVSCDSLLQAQAKLDWPLPVHFIFHSGHVGSTLVSRLLDQTGRILGLREPLPLRALADAHDLLGEASSLLSQTQFERLLNLFLALWGRGYAHTEAVVIKSTSSAGRIAVPVLSASPTSRAIYLNLRHEPYLAAILAGPAAATDLRGFAQERVRRLTRMFGELGTPLHDMGPGELAAVSWLAERMSEQTASRELGSRLLRLDFERFLEDMPGSIGAVLRHFAISANSTEIDRLCGSSVLTRYSKAPEQYAYSAGMRAEIQSRSRSENRAEIMRGCKFLEALGARHSAVAEVL